LLEYSTFISKSSPVYIYLKYIKEAGGAQDNQVKDIETFISECINCIDKYKNKENIIELNWKARDCFEFYIYIRRSHKMHGCQAALG
jgi:hypothetical protein